MKDYESLLLKILNKTIKGEKFTDDISNDFNWQELIEESKVHNISSLVYYTLDKSILGKIDDEVLEKWRKQVFVSNMIQMKHAVEISDVLRKFNEENIEVIILKGLVLRDLYPRPELRSMSDADILVKNKDIDRARRCILECGYAASNHDNDIHEGFEKSGSLEIEMHCKLINKDFFYVDFSKYENELWDNSLDIYLNDEKCKTLGMEDFFIHLILHMATHTKLFGFGIRQLYDLAVFMKKNYHQINWQKIKGNMDIYGLNRYTQGVMYAVNEIFEVDIPEIFQKGDLKKADIDLFIKNMLSAGVHGKRKLNEDFDELYLTYDYHCDKEGSIKKVMKCMFPRRSKMLYLYGSRYEYIKRNIVLIPIAWIDRISNEYIKKYGFLNTVSEIRNLLKILKCRRHIIKAFDVPD